MSSKAGKIINEWSKEDMHGVKSNIRNDIVQTLSDVKVRDLKPAGKYSATFTYGGKNYQFRATNSSLKVFGGMTFEIIAKDTTTSVKMAMAILNHLDDWNIS